MSPRDVSPQFLSNVRLFEGLQVSELADILMLGAVKEFQPEEVIFEESVPGESFYVIYDGSVRISKMFENLGEEALTVLGAGEFFGEMSFFDDEPRSARAVAHGTSKLLEVGNAQLKAYLSEHPDVSLKFLWAFARTLSRRVRETNEKFTALFAISRVF